MKMGRSLQALEAEVLRRANAKKDMVVNTKNIQMVPKLGGRLEFGDMALTANDVAHQQIATYTDIPLKYYKRMQTDSPELLCRNVNEWFGRNKEDRLIRGLDNKARAFLSDRYRPLENEDLLEAVLPVLKKLNVAVMSCEVTERRLYLKIVDQSVERKLEAKGGHFGDGQHNIVRCLSPAITVQNSEVGMGALSVLSGVSDGFCSNLATFGNRSMRKYHVGARHEIGGDDIYAMLSDSTRRKTDEAMWAQVSDVVKAAFDRARFNSLCDQIAETQTQKIEGDVVKVVSFAARKFGLTETEGQLVQKHLIEGADLSRFGLYNAITRSAQDVDEYDRATEMERLGGQVIELPPSEWKEVTHARAA